MKHSLKDSYIYDLLGLDVAVANIANKINPNLEEYQLPVADVDAIVSDIKHKAAGYGKDKIISRINNRDIILVNAPSIPLPAWCMQLDGRIVAVCNVFGKVRKDSRGNFAYQIKEVFGLCVVAYVLRAFYINEKKYLYSNQLISNLGGVYVRLMMRVLDSMFSINAMGNERESSLVEFLFAKFYLRRIMEKSTTNAQQELSNIAGIMAKSRTVRSDTSALQSFSNAANDFPDSAFESIDSLCKALSTSIPNLSRLETNLLIRKLIVTLGERSALMLESPQY